MTTQTTNEEVIIANWEQQLLEGKIFSTHAYAGMANNGASTSMRTIGRRKFSDFLIALGKLANVGDAQAHFVARMSTSVNLYGSEDAMQASVWGNASQAFALQYEDVIGRSGPEAGRRSSYLRPYTIPELLIIYAWLMHATGESLGWVAARSIQRHAIPEFALPKAS